LLPYLLRSREDPPPPVLAHKGDDAAELPCRRDLMACPSPCSVIASRSPRRGNEGIRDE
jgi:hypothetical protein